MFIVSAVNVFPSDIEYVVRGEEGLTGEYSIRVYDQNFTTKYEVSVERASGHATSPTTQVAKRVEAALKAHTGVRPAKVIVYDAGKLGTSPASTRRPASSTNEGSRGSAVLPSGGTRPTSAAGSALTRYAQSGKG